MPRRSPLPGFKPDLWPDPDARLIATPWALTGIPEPPDIQDQRLGYGPGGTLIGPAFPVHRNSLKPLKGVAGRCTTGTEDGAAIVFCGAIPADESSMSRRGS